jgi:hypothetical protein
MSRFVQETHKKKPDKKPQATLPKPGSYTSKQLKNSKTIYSNTGGKY